MNLTSKMKDEERQSWLHSTCLLGISRGNVCQAPCSLKQLPNNKNKRAISKSNHALLIMEILDSREQNKQDPMKVSVMKVIVVLRSQLYLIFRSTKCQTIDKKRHYTSLHSNMNWWICRARYQSPQELQSLYFLCSGTFPSSQRHKKAR